MMRVLRFDCEALALLNSDMQLSLSVWLNIQSTPPSAALYTALRPALHVRNSISDTERFLRTNASL
uniref:Uncharacterized protein n=1 Tax=Anguilla anguilla TaxID=7936 RepID=A0A0E9XUT4_ANGAN